MQCFTVTMSSLVLIPLYSLPGTSPSSCFTLSDSPLAPIPTLGGWCRLARLACDLFGTGKKKKTAGKKRMPASEPVDLWNFSKLRRNINQRIAELEEPSDAPRDELGHIPVAYAVLITTGALNPVHNGHVTMLEKAATELQASYGIATLGAFLSPSHDLYLQGKFANRVKKSSRRGASASGDFFFPADLRVGLAELSTEDHPFIACARWESEGVTNRWPDFPEVVSELAAALSHPGWGVREELLKLLGAKQSAPGSMEGTETESVPTNSTRRVCPRIMVIYVCGQDHYDKCGLQRGLRGSNDDITSVCVCCVSRGEPLGAVSGRGKSNGSLGTEGDLPSTFVIESKDDTTDVSSTQVRCALVKGDTDVVRRLLHPRVAQRLIEVYGGEGFKH